MAAVDIKRPAESFDDPLLIEGFPGAGLVGKIATDHLIEELGMVHYANVHCEDLPTVALYEESGVLSTPVRLFADPDTDVLALRSDVPVSPDAAEQVATCLADWYDRHDVTPVYCSGLPEERDEAPPALFGVATGHGDGDDRLQAAGIDHPGEVGVVSGPTGALLSTAVTTGRSALGLVVETDPRFPDPEAASVLLRDGVEPLTGVSVAVDDLVGRAEEIRKAREQFAARMQEAGEESSRAQPLRMYQ
jgi:uncharacterized protein